MQNLLGLFTLFPVPFIMVVDGGYVMTTLIRKRALA